MILDIRTIVLLDFIVSIINACVMVIIWRQYRTHFRGLSLLLFNMVLSSVGLFLMLWRGILPDFMTMVLSNVFQITGALLVLMGLEQFFNSQKRHIHNYILIAIFASVMTYFSVIKADLLIREICVSSMIVLISSQSCWLLFRRLNPSFRKMANITGLVVLSYIIISLIRIVFLILFPPQTGDFFKSGHVDSIALTLYLSLSIILCMSFILLVSRRLLEEVQTEKDKYNATFNSCPYAILLTKLSDGIIFEVNEGFVSITGYKPTDVVGKTTNEIGLWVSDEDRLTVVNELSKGNEAREFEMQFQVKNGRILTGVVSSKIIIAHGEKCIITTVSDITEISLLKQKMHNMAMHDSLTGLPNRILYYDRFIIAKANAQRECKSMAIISLDVDFLKQINDHWGHDAGDKVLIAISTRISDLLRKADTVARFGGDEFMILLTEISNKSDVTKIAKKIKECLSQPIKIGEDIVRMTASTGIALYPEDGTDVEVLMKKSDKALYRVKENGRNNFQFYGD